MKPDPADFVPIEEIMRATGLTKIQVRNDIKAGYIRGRIRGSQTFVLRSDWEAYGVNAKPHEPEPVRQPVGIHSLKKAS